MNQMVGYLIRSNRVKKKLSQEQLCKGICAVSYLSKIEAGIAEPNEEIIGKLFETLGIIYTVDEEELKEYSALLFQYFDAYFHHEPTVELEEQIYKNRANIENSELSITYQLFCIYNAGMNNQDTVNRLLKGIEQYREYMSDDTAFLFYMAKGMYKKTSEERIAAYRKARQIKDCSLVYEALMYEAFYAEQYQEAIQDCRIGYERAMQEGFLLVAKQISFLEGICYGNLGHIPQMMEAYRRTKELSRGDKKIESSIDYNIGTVFIDQKEYRKAIPYLLSALKYEKEGKSAFLINLKLAEAYERLNEKMNGNVYLEMATSLSKNLDEVCRKMIRMTRLRYETDYLESEEYGSLLFELYGMGESMGSDFVRFYQPDMVEWLKAKRKYKEALRVVTNNE